MTRRVSVALSLPGATYRAVAQIADERGVNAHTLIEQMVEQALAPRRPKTIAKAELLDGLVRLHARGYNDREIAETLGAHKERVRNYRHRLGLPVNGPRGRVPSLNLTEKEQTS